MATDEHDREAELEAKILELTAELIRIRTSSRPKFVPGESAVPYAGRVFDEDEVVAAVRASLEFWLTLGREGVRFERDLATLLNVKYVALVNSGSSANLVAFSALTSPSLERRATPGDEVITVAAGFPTTVNPILQNGCVPVFVDVKLSTANVDVNQLEAALSSRTRAVMLAHTLGNPFDLEAVVEFCRKHDLYLIEDNCDALGSLYDGKPTGSFGDFGTSSFYPAHHITMGEGGAVYTSDQKLRKAALSFRDWGRDCWCDSGKDNTCGRRFSWDWPEKQRSRSTDPDGPSLPFGYDHKYVYSHIGYNLKPTDVQAAIGVEQLRKLPRFVSRRRTNWETLRNLLGSIEDDWIFMEPTERSSPSWFGFLMTMRQPDHEKMTRLCEALSRCRVGHRRLFGGNLLRQPAYQSANIRVIGDLRNTNQIADGGVFLGVAPILDHQMIQYQAECFIDEWRSIRDRSRG